MNSSGTETRMGRAAGIRVTASHLIVALADGRTMTVPLRWFPRLAHGTARQRRSWRLIRRGIGIHWPELDEDIAVDDLLAGRRSGESKASLQRWLRSRPRAARKPVRSTTAARQPSIPKARRG